MERYQERWQSVTGPVSASTVGVPPSGLWVQVVYDFALAYHDRLLLREHLLKALTPLYLGYTASFVIETRAQVVEQVEQELARLNDQYETMKPYLVQRWRSHNE